MLDVVRDGIEQTKERAIEEAYLASLPKVRTEADDEEDLRRAVAPMTAADGIARTLLAWKDKDYFRCIPAHPFVVNFKGHVKVFRWGATCTVAGVSSCWLSTKLFNLKLCFSSNIVESWTASQL